MSARYARSGADRALARRHRRRAAAELALEIALCGRLIKGYGDTNRRAKANFLRIFDTLVEAAPSSIRMRAHKPCAPRAKALSPTRRAAASRHRSPGTASRRCRRKRKSSSSCAGPAPSGKQPEMERQFNAEIESLKLGEGETFHGEGILAVTKALLQSGVSYVGGLPGRAGVAPARRHGARRALHGRTGCARRGRAPTKLLRGHARRLDQLPGPRRREPWKSIVGTNVASYALTHLSQRGRTRGALIVVRRGYTARARAGAGAHPLGGESPRCGCRPRPNPRHIADWWRRGFELSEAPNTRYHGSATPRLPRARQLLAGQPRAGGVDAQSAARNPAGRRLRAPPATRRDLPAGETENGRAACPRRASITTASIN